MGSTQRLAAVAAVSHARHYYNHTTPDVLQTEATNYTVNVFFVSVTLCGVLVAVCAACWRRLPSSDKPEDAVECHGVYTVSADSRLTQLISGKAGHILKTSFPTMPEVRVEESRRFMIDSLMAVGAPESEARAQADLLIQADIVGHYSHGLNRLEFYINDILAKATLPNAKPVILKESAATAWVDGCDALGATVSNFCMDVAINKAKKSGVGWVTAKRSNHFGMAGYWALKAEKEGLIGMAFTNSSPIMVPTRAKHSALGTNPISMAAPAIGDDNIVVDLATTAVAMGKVEMQIHKEEPLTEGWALGPDGKTTTDAKLAFETARLLPLGGFEQSSGYKGYGLSAMVEVLCSGLSGSKPTHDVLGWELNSLGGPPNLGHCFVAIDPNCFAPGFGERIAYCLQHWRNMEPVDPKLPVLAPGDKERKHGEETKRRGTINYAQKQYEAYVNMAKRIGIKPMQIASI